MDTEIPKKTGDMVSGNAEEKENAKKPLVLFGREFSRKQVCAAGAGILCAALLIGGGACGLDGQSERPCGVPVKGRGEAGHGTYP